MADNSKTGPFNNRTQIEFGKTGGSGFQTVTVLGKCGETFFSHAWFTCFLKKLALARFDEATRLVIVSCEGSRFVMVFSRSATSDGVAAAEEDD
jgi:hypothetical protein